MDVIKYATLNQKKSVGNFFAFLALCDEEDINLKEWMTIDSFIKPWGITMDDCASYYAATNNHNTMYDDLMSLNRDQKEALVILSFGLANCDKRANEREFDFIIDIFDKMGINEDEIGSIVEETNRLIKGLLCGGYYS